MKEQSQPPLTPKDHLKLAQQYLITAAVELENNNISGAISKMDQAEAHRAALYRHSSNDNKKN
jgi:hypothetical protein